MNGTFIPFPISLDLLDDFGIDRLNHHEGPLTVVYLEL